MTAAALSEGRGGCRGVRQHRPAAAGPVLPGPAVTPATVGLDATVGALCDGTDRLVRRLAAVIAYIETARSPLGTVGSQRADAGSAGADSTAEGGQ
jgi:hypothetical protein